LRTKLIALVLALSGALTVAGETSASSKTVPKGKKPVVKATGKKPVVPQKTTVKKPLAPQTASVKRPVPAKKPPVHYRPVAQMQPTQDRYREIQQSLADKGYFTGPVDGTWGADSVDALKRFQRAQNIGDDGKLGSMSLIALGLGPKRDASPGVAAP